VDGGHFERLVEMVADGEVDLVAVGRMLIADADWAIKLREGRLDEFPPYSRAALATLA